MARQELWRDIEPNTFESISSRIARIGKTMSAGPLARDAYRALAAQLPIEALEALIARYGRTQGTNGPLKYLDCPYWLAHKLRHAIKLGLHTAPACRILDLGMGGGHFSYVCRQFHHDAVGIDVAFPLYDDLCRVLRVEKIVHRIRRGTPLPELNRRFEYVTAFASQFDFLGGDDYWSAEDWIEFIARLKREVLAPRGLIYFRVNKAWDRHSKKFSVKDQLAEAAAYFGGSFDWAIGELFIPASLNA